MLTNYPQDFIAFYYALIDMECNDLMIKKYISTDFPAITIIIKYIYILGF